MSAATFLCALAVAILAGGAGFAYGFFTGCRYGGFPDGGLVPNPADPDQGREYAEKLEERSE